MAKEKINFEIPAFVLGIIAVVLLISNTLGSLILGIVGLVFAYKQKGRLSKSSKVLNIIAIVLGLALTIVSIVLTLRGSSFLGGLA